MSRYKVVVSDQVFPSVEIERELLAEIDADLTVASGDVESVLEDVRVAAGSALEHVSIAAARERFTGGATLVAVQRAGRLLAPPPDDLATSDRT